MIRRNATARTVARCASAAAVGRRGAPPRRRPAVRAGRLLRAIAASVAVAPAAVAQIPDPPPFAYFDAQFFDRIRPKVAKGGGLHREDREHPFPVRTRGIADVVSAPMRVKGGRVEFVVLDWNFFQLQTREYENADDTIEDVARSVERDVLVFPKPRVLMTGTFFGRLCPDPDPNPRPGGNRLISDGDIIYFGTRLPTSPRTPATLEDSHHIRGPNYGTWVAENHWFGFLARAEADGAPGDPRRNDSRWKIRGPGRPPPAQYDAAVGGLPRLIANRTIVQKPTGKEGGNNEAEMGIGLHHPTRQIIVAALGGVAMAEVKQFFKAIDVDDAVLVDGASTPGLYIDGTRRVAEMRHNGTVLTRANASCIKGYVHTPTNYLLFLPIPGPLP